MILTILISSCNGIGQTRLSENQISEEKTNENLVRKQEIQSIKYDAWRCLLQMAFLDKRR